MKVVNPKKLDMIHETRKNYLNLLGNNLIFRDLSGKTPWWNLDPQESKNLMIYRNNTPYLRLGCVLKEFLIESSKLGKTYGEFTKEEFWGNFTLPEDISEREFLGKVFSIVKEFHKEEESQEKKAKVETVEEVLFDVYRFVDLTLLQLFMEKEDFSFDFHLKVNEAVSLLNVDQQAYLYLFLRNIYGAETVEEFIGKEFIKYETPTTL